MTDDESHWDILINGLRAGDEEIVRQFYETYGGILERLAARNLESGLRRRFGPDEVAHSALRTFLRRCQGGQFELDTTDSLWSADLFRYESIVLQRYWVLVVMDQFTRRLIGLGVQRGAVEGTSLCRIFNDRYAVRVPLDI